MSVLIRIIMTVAVCCLLEQPRIRDANYDPWNHPALAMVKRNIFKMFTNIVYYADLKLHFLVPSKNL